MSFSSSDIAQSSADQSLRDIIMSYDSEKIDLEDDAIDTLLGLNIPETESTINSNQITRRYGPEQFTYEGTPYDFIRIFLAAVNLNPDDRVYDLGSGYGRVVLYGALTRPSWFCGIEIVPERVANAQQVVERLAITNAEFRRQNILESDYADGTIFFLFNPFSDETIQIVLKQLHSIAQNKRIKIVVWGGGGVDQLARLPWLEEVIFRDQSGTLGHWRLKLFQSK